MANAAVVYSNLVLASATVLTVSSQAGTMPSTNLLTSHVGERWRSASNADSISIDKGSASADDTVAVFGLTLSTAGTVRLRLSNVSAGAGEILDTGALANQATTYFDLDYGAFVYLLAAPGAWRYAKIDLADASASYVEAGAVLIGTRTLFTYNFAPGQTIGYVDRSRLALTAGGMTLTYPDNYFRRLQMNFPWLSSAQRYGVVEAMQRLNGKHKNVLMMQDTASTNLARDSIFGLVTDLSPVTRPEVIALFGTQFSIDERL